MARRAATVGEATYELVVALGDLASAASRWLSLQPVTRNLPKSARRMRRQGGAVAGSAAEWVGQTGTRARDATQRAAAATRATAVDLLIVALLLWWIDRRLTGA